MTLKSVFIKIKKNWGSLLFYALVLVLIFSPTAKSWMLRRINSTGLFNAEIKNERTTKNESSVQFSLSDLNGNIISSNSFKGKVVLINFWASWCPPCRAEMPSLNKLFLQFKNDNRFVFLFVTEDEDISKAMQFLQKNNFSIPIYTRNEMPAEIFKGNLPTTVVLDRQGKIVLKHEGMADYDNVQFIRQLQALL